MPRWRSGSGSRPVTTLSRARAPREIRSCSAFVPRKVLSDRLRMKDRGGLE